MLASPLFSFNTRKIVERTMTNRLPAIYQWPETAEEGGLLAYGPRITGMYRQMARQLIKLMRGVKPADIPIAARSSTRETPEMQVRFLAPDVAMMHSKFHIHGDVEEPERTGIGTRVVRK